MRALLPTPRVSSSNGTSEAELAAGNPYKRLETEVELFPTPNAYDGSKGGSQHPAKRRAGGHQPSVADVVEHLLPTPCASPSGNTPEEHLRKKPGRERVTDLSIIAENDLFATGGKLFPTPRASDGEKGGPNQRGSKGDLTVSSAVHLLPTPKAGDAEFGLPRTSGRPAEKSTHLATRLHYTDFGQYTPAIDRWEAVMGREAPAPTEPTAKGKQRLSAAFVEWLMGQSQGWVTDPDLSLSRAQQLRCLGNGVVTQQAVYALNWLIHRADHTTRRAA